MQVLRQKITAKPVLWLCHKFITSAKWNTSHHTHFSVGLHCPDLSEDLSCCSLVHVPSRRSPAPNACWPLANADSPAGHRKRGRKENKKKKTEVNMRKKDKRWKHQGVEKWNRREQTEKGRAIRKRGRKSQEIAEQGKQVNHKDVSYECVIYCS